HPLGVVLDELHVLLGLLLALVDALRVGDVARLAGDGLHRLGELDELLLEVVLALVEGDLVVALGVAVPQVDGQSRSVLFWMVPRRGPLHSSWCRAAPPIPAAKAASRTESSADMPLRRWTSLPISLRRSSTGRRLNSSERSV